MGTPFKESLKMRKFAKFESYISETRKQRREFFRGVQTCPTSKTSTSFLAVPYLRHVARRDENYCTCLSLGNSTDFIAYFARVLIDFFVLKSWKDLLTIRSVALRPVSANSGFIL